MHQNQIRTLQGQGLGESEIAAALGLELQDVKKAMVGSELDSFVPSALMAEAVGTAVMHMRQTEDANLSLRAAKQIMDAGFEARRLQLVSPVREGNMVQINLAIQQGNEDLKGVLAAVMEMHKSALIDV
jgi:hypothetical protein